MNIIVAGIGTEIGKTVISAILCEALQAHYWKPVQAGDLHHTDTDKVGDLVSHEAFQSHPEIYRLEAAMSPHAAAARQGITVNARDFIRPETQGRPLVTELAGGLMAPLCDNFLMVDLCEQLKDPIILVANFYLGSINHTLLSLDIIRARKLNLAGIIFNGDANLESRDFILNYSQAPLLADIPLVNLVNKTFVKTHAEKIRNHPGLA